MSEKHSPDDRQMETVRPEKSLPTFQIFIEEMIMKNSTHFCSKLSSGFRKEQEFEKLEHLGIRCPAGVGNDSLRLVESAVPLIAESLVVMTAKGPRWKV